MRRPVGIGSHQLFDQAGASAVALPHGALTTITATGTKWPLLPDTSYKFYNGYLNVAASVNELVKISMAAIVVSIIDAAGNLCGKVGIGAGTWPDPTWCQGGFGPVIVATGDPLAEFWSNLNFTGAVPGAPAFMTPAFFQVGYAADLFNSDSNDHTANLVGSVIFSALPRGL